MINLSIQYSAVVPFSVTRSGEGRFLKIQASRTKPRPPLFLLNRRAVAASSRLIKGVHWNRRVVNADVNRAGEKSEEEKEAF